MSSIWCCLPSCAQSAGLLSWMVASIQGCQMLQMRTILSSVCFVCSHWLVVTDDGHMVTGRQQPRLVLVSLTCEGGHVCLNGPNMEELRFPFKQADNPVLNCRFHIRISLCLHNLSLTLIIFRLLFDSVDRHDTWGKRPLLSSWSKEKFTQK